MVVHSALLPLLLVVSASAQGATTITCAASEGCQVRPDAKDNVLLQKQGSMKMEKTATDGAAEGLARARKARADSFRTRTEAQAKVHTKTHAKARRANYTDMQSCDWTMMQAVCNPIEEGCACDAGQESCADLHYGYGWCDGGWGCPKCDWTTHMECWMPDGSSECKTIEEGCPCGEDEAKCHDLWGWSWCQNPEYGECPTWEPPCPGAQVECWDYTTWEVSCNDQCSCDVGEPCDDGHGYGWCSEWGCPVFCDMATDKYCWDAETENSICHPKDQGYCPGHPCDNTQIECWECAASGPEPEPQPEPAPRLAALSFEKL